ncbi:hypothetical protein RND81_10G221800 [Saponaria officinalis]|uniref:Dynein light chain n=1 Tax=Saponaria officinalis TaxID=3572 RepID=A0AAW1I7I6_SAPOF
MSRLMKISRKKTNKVFSQSLFISTPLSFLHSTTTTNTHHHSHFSTLLLFYPPNPNFSPKLMAHNSSNRRRLAVPVSEPIPNPTVKRPLYPPPPKPLTKSADLGHKVLNLGKRVVLESEKQDGECKNERRKSIGEVKVDLGSFLISNGAKVMSADMPPFIQIHAVGFARKVKDSLEKFSSKTLASSLKKEFDGVYGPAWHCIVGNSFGSFVTHTVGGFLYFSLDQKLYVLLFKTSVQRAD